MKKNTENKVITQEIITYIAEDGKEFTTEKNCLVYEKELIFRQNIEAAEKLRMKKFDEILPLDSSGTVNDNNIFRWYTVNTEEDFIILNDAYRKSLERPSKYPEIICVETCGYKAYMDDAYDYHMTTCMEMTEKFWKTLGYKIVFEKEHERN